MKLKTNRICTESVAAQTIGVHTEFQFFDAVLGVSTLVVPFDEVFRRSFAIGNHEADVGSHRGNIDLHKNTAAMVPTPCAVPEAGAHLNRMLSPLIARFGLG